MYWIYPSIINTEKQHNIEKKIYFKIISFFSINLTWLIVLVNLPICLRFWSLYIPYSPIPILTAEYWWSENLITPLVFKTCLHSTSGKYSEICLNFSNSNKLCLSLFESLVEERCEQIEIIFVDLTLFVFDLLCLEFFECYDFFRNVKT